MKNNMYSIRLNDRHNKLISTSASLNNCSKAKVMEDALNKYYNIDNALKTIQMQKLKVTRVISGGKFRNITNTKKEAEVFSKVMKLFKKIGLKI